MFFLVEAKTLWVLGMPLVLKIFFVVSHHNTGFWLKPPPSVPTFVSFCFIAIGRNIFFTFSLSHLLSLCLSHTRT